MVKSLVKAFENAKENGNLIHCITNPISITQCANTVLSIGSKPIMAEHPKEVSSITASAGALLLNIGNINDTRIRSIKKALKAASLTQIPVVLDMVGIACSEFRRRFVIKLLKKHHIHILKGNYSEIFALYSKEYKGLGIDSDPALMCTMISDISKSLAKKYNCIILASGKADIVTDGNRLCLIKNGTTQLSQITGTGCMLGALAASFASCGDNFLSSILSCAVLGISGEEASANNKNGTFFSKLMDNISSFDSSALQEKLKLEVI